MILWCIILLFVMLAHYNMYSFLAYNTYFVRYYVILWYHYQIPTYNCKPLCCVVLHCVDLLVYMWIYIKLYLFSCNLYHIIIFLIYSSIKILYFVYCTYSFVLLYLCHVFFMMLRHRFICIFVAHCVLFGCIMCCILILMLCNIMLLLFLQISCHFSHIVSFFISLGWLIDICGARCIYWLISNVVCFVLICAILVVYIVLF